MSGNVRVNAAQLIAAVCNEHKNSDLRADDARMLAAIDSALAAAYAEQDSFRQRFFDLQPEAYRVEEEALGGRSGFCIVRPDGVRLCMAFYKRGDADDFADHLNEAVAFERAARQSRDNSALAKIRAAFDKVRNPEPITQESTGPDLTIVGYKIKVGNWLLFQADLRNALESAGFPEVSA